MRFSQAAVSTIALAGAASAFAPKAPKAFVITTTKTNPATSAAFVKRSIGCGCDGCAGGFHASGCSCGSSCACRSRTALFADVAADDAAVEEVPAEVEALDGIESTEEAHNADRPARKSLKKKPKGKPLSEFTVGQSVAAKVKTITNYGAFLDIGAATDGLLHISQLAVGFISDVSEVLEVGQDVDVRITKIDEEKGQVALSMLTEEQEGEAAGRPRRERPQRGSNRRDDRALLAQLVEKGWNSEQFVEGTVVSTVDFGCFVRIDASQLQEEVEGTFDGLVHISALSAGRVSSVDTMVAVDDKVQVRVKAIADRKVSLTMVSPEEEAAKMEAIGAAVAAEQGAKDWKESLVKLQDSMPEFKNRPLVLGAK